MLLALIRSTTHFLVLSVHLIFIKPVSSHIILLCLCLGSDCFRASSFDKLVSEHIQAGKSRPLLIHFIAPIL